MPLNYFKIKVKCTYPPLQVGGSAGPQGKNILSSGHVMSEEEMLKQSLNSNLYRSYKKQGRYYCFIQWINPFL